MSVQEDQRALYDAFTSWVPGVPVYGPGEDPVALAPSSDPSSPSCYVAWKLVDVDKQRTSVGTAWAERAVTISAWGLEAERPSDTLTGILDLAAIHLYSNPPTGFTFLQDETLEDERTTKSGYFGVGMQIPYLKPEAVVNG
jgi:hypothetical protein